MTQSHITKPKMKYSTHAMQGKRGRGGGAEGLPEQPGRKHIPLREKVPKHLKTRSLPLRVLKTQQ